jgi:hypothetical protein
MTPENSSPCHLGALPRELLDCVLFEFETVADLARFIRTARFVYRRARRPAVLWRVLQNELGPVLADAKFLNMFPYADPTDRENYYDYMNSMAVVYRDMLNQPLDAGGASGGGGGASGVPGGEADALPPSLGELTMMCRTLRQVNFLADMYARAQLRSFQPGGEGVSLSNPSPTTTTRPSSSLGATTAPLSPIERQRVLRAFYRRQIVSNAWAPTRRQTVSNDWGPARRWPHWGPEDIAAMSSTGEHPGTPLGLMSVFESWENQQVDHANLFVTRLCLCLVRCSRASLSASPLKDAEFREICSHQDSLVDYLRASPKLVEEALGKMAALAARAAGSEADFYMDNMDMDRGEDEDSIPSLFDELVSPCCLLPLVYEWQLDRWRTFPEPLVYRWEREGKEVKYAGDAVGLPPFAWIDGLEGNFVNWYGEGLANIPRFALRSLEKCRVRHRTCILWRCAGFALWDRPRVEALKQVQWLENSRTGWVLGV